MRRKIVAGNWKMNLDKDDAEDLACQIHANLIESTPCDVILFPSFIYLSDIQWESISGYFAVGAQNCSQYENGAYTGDVSASQLASLGVEYVIIGHSERREHFGETNSILKGKLKIALKYKLKRVFCCGEPLEVRKSDGQQDYVLKQLQESLFEFSAEEFSNVVIAYEPIWAIGSGLNATAAQAQEMHSFIRQKIAAKYTQAVANNTRIIYGGSCKPDNARELFRCEDVDGGLIGGASLKANDFLAIIEATR